MNETKMDDIVWLIGASSGIGRALALELARRGRRLVVSARSAEPLEALADEAESFKGSIAALTLDVTDDDAVTAAAENIRREHGRIGCMIFSAAYWQMSELESFDELDVESFEKTFSVNVIGAVKALRAVLPQMEKEGSGRLVMLSSVAGYRGLPNAHSYGSSKAALTHLCEVLRFDCEKRGLVMQVVHPGFVDTPMTQNNPFPMPFIVSPDLAARRIADGMETDRFEITFPKRFTYQLKWLRTLPYWLYFKLVGKATGAAR